MPQRYDCVLLCGGRGSRMLPVTGDKVPKALVKIAGRELIRYATDLISPAFIDGLIFAVDHHQDQMRAWIALSDLPYRVSISTQEKPGYLNAVQCAAHKSDKDTILFCHTDEIKPGLDLWGALDRHSSSKSLATVVATRSGRLVQHWVVSYDASDKVLGFTDKPQDRGDAVDVVLAGALVLNRRALDYVNPDVSTDYLGVVQPLVDAGELKVFVSPSHFLFNVGTREEYYDAQKYLSGIEPGV